MSLISPMISLDKESIQICYSKFKKPKQMYFGSDINPLASDTSLANGGKKKLTFQMVYLRAVYCSGA